MTDDNPGATSWTPEVPDQPANGTVTVNSDGSFVYTPDPGFVGRDSFSYTLTDNLGYTSAPALVTINVALAFSVTANGAALRRDAVRHSGQFRGNRRTALDDGHAQLLDQPRWLGPVHLGLPHDGDELRRGRRTCPW